MERRPSRPRREHSDQPLPPGSFLPEDAALPATQARLFRLDLAALAMLVSALPGLVLSGALMAGVGALAGWLLLDRPGSAMLLTMLWLLSGALVPTAPVEAGLARLAGCRPPTESERLRLEPAWRQVTTASSINASRYEVWVRDSERVNAFALGGRIVAVTRSAVQLLPPMHLSAVLAHELGHHQGGHAVVRSLTYWYSLPSRLLGRVLLCLPYRAVVLGVAGSAAGLIVGWILIDLIAGGQYWAAVVAAGVLTSPLLLWWSLRAAEHRADRVAAALGYGLALRELLLDEASGGNGRPSAATAALGAHSFQRSRARRLDRMALAAAGPRHPRTRLAGASTSAPAPSPSEGRLTWHNLAAGQVRLGKVVPTPYGGIGPTRDFGVDLDVLRTSLLVIGPPGAGKTRSFALPIVEHLSLAAGAGKASVVVVDPKGDDFDYPEWFDVTIDPLAGGVGFDLFGGVDEADIAADRLASALLPPEISDDLAYFMDASRNALYHCLAPYRQAFDRWPSIPELMALLRGEQRAIDQVRSTLAGPDARPAREMLESRMVQRAGRTDPAASMVERLGLLNRPRLVRLFDPAAMPFRMRDINKPLRVRIALPEAEFPDASRILARLVVSQFVQTVSAAGGDRTVFKALVIDEAGRFVDDYVARGVQKLRSHNAGLVLLSQTVSDFPPTVRATVFGSVGGKAVFGGIDPADAELFSAWFGTTWVPEVTRNRSEHASITESSSKVTTGIGQGRGTSMRLVERPVWSPSDLITGVPPGHCVVAVSRSTGERSGPLLVNLRR
jgi:Zn-dependent protease with chaperone function